MCTVCTDNMTATLYRDNENVRCLRCSCPTAGDCIEDVLVPGFSRSKRHHMAASPLKTTHTSAVDRRRQTGLESFGTEGSRTTNNIEAMHGKLKRNVQHTHTHTFNIIQTFKEIQNSNDINRI